MRAAFWVAIVGAGTVKSTPSVQRSTSVLSPADATVRTSKTAARRIGQLHAWRRGDGRDRRRVRDGLASFTRLVDGNATLHARLQLIWERDGQGLADTLAAEVGGSPLDPRIRTAAALLITPFRVPTSSDVRGRRTDDDTAAWIDTRFDLVATGLDTRLDPGLGAWPHAGLATGPATGDRP